MTVRDPLEGVESGAVEWHEALCAIITGSIMRESSYGRFEFRYSRSNGN